jgi:uroporphyrinogen-III decarboxylase
VHIHSHGSIKKVLQGFVDMGVDVLHPFETPSQGDLTAREAKPVIRGKICMEGNIQISNMYEHTPEEIKEETEQLIKDAFDDHKGLIVSASASPYIPGEGLNCLEQYRAMVETVLMYR